MWSGGTSYPWESGALIDIVLWATATIVGVVVYLAGAAFAMRLRNVIRARRYSGYESTWEPLFLDVIDGSIPVSDLLDTVSPRSTRHFLTFLVRYARLLAGSDRQIIAEIAAPVLPRILGDLGARSSSRRALAVQTLATLGIEEHGARIARALDDSSPLVSMVAARSLAGSHHPEYIGNVLSNLHRYTEWNSRFLASMLASLGVEVAPALRSFLRADGNPIDRAVAAEALGMLTDPAAGEIAAYVLTSGPHRELATALLRLLQKVGGPEHVEIVRNYATSRDFALRALALRSLGTIGDQSDLEILEQGIFDSDPWVALNAARAMLEAGGDDRLVEIAQSELPQAILAQELIEGRAA